MIAVRSSRSSSTLEEFPKAVQSLPILDSARLGKDKSEILVKERVEILCQGMNTDHESLPYTFNRKVYISTSIRLVP